MLQEPITPEKKLHLEQLLDRIRKDALDHPYYGVTFLTVVKVKGHPQIMLEVGGDEAERELLMAFFMKWALGRAADDINKRAQNSGLPEAGTGGTVHQQSGVSNGRINT